MSDRLADLYPAHIETLTQRHARALEETRFDHLIVFAGALHYAFLDDNSYPFRPNPLFKWWVPVVDNPNCSVVFTPGQKPRLIFFQPVDYWYKPAETPFGYWTRHFDITVIGAPEDAEQQYPKSGRIAFLGEIEGQHPGERNPEDLIHRLHFDRITKTAYEVECMRRANRIGAMGHRAAERAFRAGASEYEMHLEYLRATNHTEEELPYSNIIGTNRNAAVLHYLLHEREHLDASKRHSFLIDAGASVNGYASDITRTYAQREDEFAEMVEAMHEGQQEICAAVKPKVRYPDLHMLAHRKIAGILERFGMARDIDADGIVTRRISSTFFPHGVGHYIGLQVHDVGGFLADASGKTIPKPEGQPYLRITRAVDVNQVFTIEPGIYFIDSLLAELRNSENAKYIEWPRVDEFRKYGGIRIEDDVVVTETGHENLTRAAFAEV